MVQTIEDGIADGEQARLHRLRAPGTDDVWLGLIQRGSRDTDKGLRPVLVIHGSTFGVTLFDLPVAGYSMLRELAGSGRAVYAIDVRGYGLSLNGRVMDAPPDANPPFGTLEHAVLDIGAAVDFILARENATALDMIGSSWGTITAALYATRYPQKVARLVLSAPLYAERNEPWLERIANPDNRRQLHPRFGAYRLQTLEELTQRWTDDLGNEDPASRREPNIAAAIFSALSAADPRALSHRPPALRIPNGALVDLVTVFNGEPLYDPAKLTMPTLIIRGAGDTTSTDSDARRLLARVAARDKDYHIVSPGSHFLCVERNRHQWYDPIRRFLDGDSSESFDRKI
ncbi:alpha/beta fold hydrolase [Ferrovibrio sp.]|uniref:alpha/beta hydrolase n=1 Tax=Ferrovibrio sp. TaxID=1917215 RepID=UPI0025C6FD46|nr:alpha/beta fold hydrolase [Ferrovibrio sp.]